MTHRFEDKKFGKLTVINATDKRHYSSVVWQCQCECGNKIEASSFQLKNGTAEACPSCLVKNYKNGGKRKYIDLTGLTVGNIKVLSRDFSQTKKTQNKSARWHCECPKCKGGITLESACILNRKKHRCQNCAEIARKAKKERILLRLKATDEKSRLLLEKINNENSQLSIGGKFLYDEKGSYCIIESIQEAPWKSSLVSIAIFDNTGKWIKQSGCTATELLERDKAVKNHYGVLGMGYQKNLIGKQFGLLKVIGFYGNDSRRKSIWVCECECGNTKNIRGDILQSSQTISCGCTRRSKK